MATIIRQQMADLSTLVRTPPDDDESKPIDRAIILLHGWGADAADLIELAPAIAAACPQALVIAPDAPQVCSASPQGRQWFPLDGDDRNAIDNGPMIAQPNLTKLIELVQQDYAIKSDKIWLMGFSQGAMMALYVGLRLPSEIGGIIGFSGAMLAPERLAAEITARPPCLLIHGKKDEVVPFQALELAEAVLKNNGVMIEAVAEDTIGHEISPEGFRRAIEFICSKD